MRIMGIDPGFAIIGYGIIDYKGNRFNTANYGIITTSADMDFTERLMQLDNKLEIIIRQFCPDVFSIEELFFNKNIKTALAAAHGRGVCLLSAARTGKRVYEYTPLQVKQAVVGYGRADKKQVQQMVKVILNLSDIPKPDDAADALAVAVCHAHSYNERNMKNV